MVQRDSGLSFLALLSLLGLVLFAPSVLWAQNEGAINGLVKDPSGALIPGAIVTVKNESTNGTITVTTQSNGAYLVPNLLPGLYTVAGEAKGFKRLAVSGLNLDAGTNLTQDLILEIGATATSISVVGSTSLVETTTNMQGTTIDSRQLLEMPLMGRNVFDLLNTIPGMYTGFLAGNIQDTSAMVGPGSTNFNVMPLLDGVDNASGTGNFGNDTGYPQIRTPPDDLQEFRIETNNMSAEYGHSSVVFVNAVTKSGGNQYHGDLYTFFHNDVTDAAGWGNTTRPRLQTVIPGVTLGGPIRKNKTFFFFGYERAHQNVGTTVLGNVGLPAWRTGNFTTATEQETVGGVATAVVDPIYDPATYNPATKTIQQFQCNGVLNVICPNRINSVAQKALPYMPLPNIPPGNPYNNGNNFETYPVNVTTLPDWIGRVDEQLSEKTKTYFRYLNTPQHMIGYGGVSGTPQSGPLQTTQNNIKTSQNMVLGYTHLFSPTFFVDAQVGEQRQSLYTGNFYKPNVDNGEALLGIGANPTYVPPTLAFSGGLVPVDNMSGGTSRLQTVTNTSFSGDFTKVMGAQTIKFGGQWQDYNNNLNSEGGGSFTFNGTYTQGIANGKPISTSGINLADFELGNYTALSVGDTPTYGLRMKRYAGYLQDDWRVRPNLTLNLGLRYETLSPPTSQDGVLQSFDPFVPNPGAGTGSIPAGAMGITTFENLNGQGKYLWAWYKKDGLMPRFGFAYRVGGRSDFVVRGGFGIFFGNSLYNNLSEGLGYNIAVSQSYAANTNPSPAIGPSVISPSILVKPPVSALTPTFGDIGTPYAQSSISFWYPNRANPYSMEYNFDVQRQWKGILFDVGYIGTFVRHLPLTYNINLIPPQLLSETSVPSTLRRPFTEFSGSNPTVTADANSVGVSDYNALTFRTERRYSNGLSWTTAFTWSKWIDDLDEGSSSISNAADNPNLQNIYNLRGERALGNQDIPWNFVFAPIYELPIGRGKAWLNHGGVVNGFVGGWEMGLVGRLHAGPPLGPTVLSGGTNDLLDPNATLRPNLVAGCNPHSPNQWQAATGGVRGIQYINPACFTTPAEFTYGDQPRELSNLLGPGIRVFNLSASKNFYIKERYRLQIRAEAMDLFNTPVFNAPTESLNGGNFGIITASDGLTKRIMDFEMKLYF